MNKPVRNGKIDLLRFVFCLCVVIVHIEGAVYDGFKAWGWITLADRGYIGVEFFFLISGFLMAKKIASLDDSGWDLKTLGGETYRFIWSKLRPVIPYHVIFCLVVMTIWAINYSAATFWKLLLERLPSLFFLHRIGISGSAPKDVLGLEWYISSMLLCMTVLYPLGRRYGRTFRSLALVAGMLVCGYLMTETGHINGGYELLGVTYKCNWRALGELMMGMGCYEACCALRQRQFSRRGAVLLTLAEWSCYGLVFLYMFSSLSDAYDMYALCLLAVGITLSFAEKGCDARWPMFCNRFCVWLGKISLPVYLAQVPFLSFLPVYWKTATDRQMSFGILLGTVAAGVLAWVLVEAFGKFRASHK